MLLLLQEGPQGKGDDAEVTEVQPRAAPHGALSLSITIRIHGPSQCLVAMFSC